MTGQPPIDIPLRGVQRARFLRALLDRPLAAVSLAYVVALLVVAIFGANFTPHDPSTGSLSEVLAPPSAAHLLGSDSAGRDVLSRLIVATQVTVAAAALAVAVALVIGVTTGLIAGYFRGWFSAASSWITALVMALPSIVVLLATRSVLGPSVWIAMVVLGVLIAPSYFRLVYASVSAVREELYIDAARVSGLSDARIIGRHILSVVRAPIIIQSSIIAGIAIAVQSGLEFLGLGDLSQPTWGSLLNDGFANLYRQPLLMMWPAIAIALTCLALALLANAMRDVLERTVTVRRRRRRTVSSATGSIALPTLTIPLHGGEIADIDELPDDDAITLVTHEDDAHSRAKAHAEPLLKIRDLRVSYATGRDEIEVVHGVSIDIRPGEVHGLVGESGSGKSQTAFATLGLLSRGGRVSGGSITFDGLDLTDVKTLSRLRGRRIGYIPQEPMTNLDPSFTIGFQLIEPLRTHLGLTLSAARVRAVSLLERVGILHPERVLGSYPHEISGGMAQRVLIAGAVSTDPDLIIADEPTTALDVTIQAEVLDLLRDLQRERGTAMLLVTHNFGVVSDLCDRVTVMREGRFVEQGPVRTILRSPVHPYTRALKDSLLEGGPVRSDLPRADPGELSPREA